MEYICHICNLSYKTPYEKANHMRWNHEMYDKEEYKQKMILSAEKANERRFGKWQVEEVICSNSNCDNKVIIKYRENKKLDSYFCCQSCANKRILSGNSKEKIGYAIKKLWKNGNYDTDSYWEKQNENNKKFSSKTEREIVKYFKNKYPEYNWKSGGAMLIAGERIARDLWSDVLKVCFEYDGIWHFKDINGQVERKQHKDYLLEEWCIKNKYRLIRIDEMDFIGFEQIESLIFERIEPIIKIGQRYRRSPSG